MVGHVTSNIYEWHEPINVLRARPAHVNVTKLHWVDVKRQCALRDWQSAGVDDRCPQIDPDVVTEPCQQGTHIGHCVILLRNLLIVTA